MPRSTSLFSIVLFVAAVLPFLGGYHGDFIQDDVPLIRDNSAIRDVREVPRLFTQLYWQGIAQADLYRPLTMASYALDGVLWGRDAAGAPRAEGVRTNNFLLHGVVTLLLFALLRRMCPDGAAPFLGALLFALHPVHTEAIVHLVGRADLLMTVFLLGGYLCAGGARPRRGPAALCYLCSMLSKEMGVMLLPLLLWESWCAGGRRTLGEFVRAESARLWPLMSAVVIFLLMRGMVIGASLEPPALFAFTGPSQFTAFPEPKPGEIFFTSMHALGVYVLLSIAPLWHSADYSGFPHASAAGGNFTMAMLLMTLICATALFRASKGDKTLLFWGGWFALAILPVSNLIFVSGIVLAERAVYLPSIAACAVMGIYGAGTIRRWRAAALLYAALAAVFFRCSLERSREWQDSRRIFEYSEQQSPFFGFIGQGALVTEYLKRLDAEPALLGRTLLLTRRAASQTTTTLSVSQLAEVLARAGNYDESFRWWEGLWRALPGSARYYEKSQEVLRLLISQHEKAGRYGDALKVIKIGLADARTMKRYQDVAWLRGKEDELAARESIGEGK